LLPIVLDNQMTSDINGTRRQENLKVIDLAVDASQTLRSNMVRRFDLSRS
jgi:hypothetical protein